MNRYNEAFIRNLSDEEFLVVVEANINEDDVKLNKLFLASAIQRIEFRGAKDVRTK